MEKELGAAEELYLAQPSLSQMVKELEADLGRKVFVRKREGVEETEFGRKLLDRLEMVKKQFHQMRVELEEFQQMNKVLFKSLFGSGGFGVLSP